MPDPLVMMMVDTHGNLLLPPTELALRARGRYRMTRTVAPSTSRRRRLYMIDGTGQWFFKPGPDLPGDHRTDMDR